MVRISFSTLVGQKSILQAASTQCSAACSEELFGGTLLKVMVGKLVISNVNHPHYLLLPDLLQPEALFKACGIVVVAAVECLLKILDL